MKSIRRFTVAILVLFVASLPAFAGDPNGIWKFEVKGPNGGSVESKLTLKWENNRLSGAVDNRAGKAEISEATFAEDQITFTVVRKIGRRLRKQTFTTKYAGKLQGDAIKGTIESTGRDQKLISLSWEAQRVK